MVTFIELHEKDHGPIGDWESALEKEPGNFEMTPEMEDVWRCRFEYEGALVEMRSALRLVSGV